MPPGSLSNNKGNNSQKQVVVECNLRKKKPIKKIFILCVEFFSKQTTRINKRVNLHAAGSKIAGPLHIIWSNEIRPSEIMQA